MAGSRRCGLWAWGDDHPLQHLRQGRAKQTGGARPAERAARPLAAVGQGSADRYLVYGNLFLDNPTEALLQAEGNVVLYNSVFVNRHGDGVMLREHNDVPRAIDMFGNTVLARGTGVLLAQ